MDRTFGKQEMDILVTLIRRRDWVTGEELALLLGTSKKNRSAGNPQNFPGAERGV